MISFFVSGTPRTAGSKKAFPLWRGKGSGKQFVRSIVVDSSGSEGKAWRSCIQFAAQGVLPADWQLLQCALRVTMVFRVVRPKCHFGKKGLKPSAPPFPATKPDVLKLARAVEDALTGIIWRDDSQIVSEMIAKRYADAPGVAVEIEIMPKPNPEAATPGQQAA